jgi:hypothetical protein
MAKDKAKATAGASNPPAAKKKTKPDTSRSTASADMMALEAMVHHYERQEFGTVAPNDARWPFARFAKYAQEVFEDGTSDYEPGELLLIFLVGCKRQGTSVADILNQAAFIASKAEADYFAEQQRATDDGNPLPAA